MNWVKIIFMFQAIITLVIGFVFFSQVSAIAASDISEIKIDLTSKNSAETMPTKIEEIKHKYTSAFFILLFISIIEIITIAKAFS